jgi:uncharacterized SAM-binding protein YcdF (DUF218 family)
VVWSPDLLALSLPAVSVALVRLVGDSAPLARQQAASAQAIVVLGAGLRRDGVEYGGDTLSRFGLERVRYAALLARETQLPVLVTGGRVYGRRAEADVMQEVLEPEFSVPVRWVENEARNTHENALRSAKLLHHKGISRVLVVSHGVDTRRTRREFSSAGLEVISSATDIPPPTIHSPIQLLPSIEVTETTGTPCPVNSSH